MTTQPTLPQVAHQHHERLMETVNRMPALADALLSAPAADVDLGIREMREFLTLTLVPHVDAAERAIYPELERMFQNRHSMAPMRREHAQIRELTTEFGRLADDAAGQVTLGRSLALRRVLYHLYALLKIHLAEEEAYMRLIGRGVSEDVADAVAAALEHPVAGS
ncbi:MAG: hemerythrin domain-containing protein [Chloroflexota bacterium]